MRNKSLALLCTTSIFTLVCMLGCVVDDSDRCLDDTVWSEAERGCIPKPEVSDTDTSTPPDSESSVDTTRVDTSSADSDTASGEGSGLGETCQADTDCGTHAASFCMKDPLAPTDPGECTIPDCTPTDCGTEYACCDCTTTFITWPTPVCAPNTAVGDLTTLAGCTCQENITEPGPEPELGLGESCVDDSICASYTANYCMKDPLAPNDPGECTIQNCTQADCGTEYTCCDCTSTFITWPSPVCAPNGAVGDLTSLAGCACEGGSK